MKLLKTKLELLESLDPDENTLNKYRSLEHVRQGLRYKIDRNNAKLSSLVQEYIGKIVFTDMNLSLAPQQGHDIATLDQFWFDRRMHYLARKSSKPNEKQAATTIFDLAQRIRTDEKYWANIPEKRKAMEKDAAKEHLRQKRVAPGSTVDPNEIFENIRVYQTDEHKFKWLHNPVKFGDDPKYAGSPDHYDWKGATTHLYFLLADWLETNGTPFQKLFAAMDEGKPWIVAVAANHGFVLHIHENKATVYQRGHDPIPAKKYLDMRSTSGGVGTMLKQDLTDLDKHGVYDPSKAAEKLANLVKP